MRRAGVIGAGLAIAVLLTGCTGSPSEPAEPVPNVDAVIDQARADYTRNLFSMRITNTADAPLAIASAAYDSPRFAEPAVFDDHVIELAPGRTVDIRVAIPPPDCDGADEPGTVVITSESGAEVEVVPTDPTGVMDRLSSEGCLTADVDAVVTVAPPTALRVDGDGADAVAHIDLVFTPTGADGEVVFASVRSTPLMSPAGEEKKWPLGLTMTAADAATSVTLDMKPTRCDAHALADDKIGTVLVFDTSTSTGRSGRYLLPLPSDVKAGVFAYISAVCGL